MQKPITRMNAATIGQPKAIAAGPPLFQPRPKLVKQPARIEMIENEMAKLEKPDHDRFNSCLYPSSASRCSSALSTVSVTDALPVRSRLLDVGYQAKKIRTSETLERALVLLHAPG